MSKEFVVFTDNHALSFLNGKEKLNQIHLKWVEYLQSYKFTIKQKKGTTNKVIDALSRRIMTMQEIQLKSVGLSELKDLYKDDKDFAEIYNFCSDFSNTSHVSYSKYMI